MNLERENMKAKLKHLFAPVVDYYRDLRPSNIGEKRYRHILLLLYWGIYGMMFFGVERIFPRFFDIEYTAIWCPLDDVIPFCEWFVFPYYFWFAFLILPGLIWFLWEPDVFRHFMWSVMITYTVGVIIFLVFPNKQDLRPVDFERDNFMIDIVRALYDFDTNTNVCPSIHVLGAFCVQFAAMKSRIFRGWRWQTAFWISTVLISISTVFLRQHSILDIFVALAVAAFCYVVQFVLYPLWRRKHGKV